MGKQHPDSIMLKTTYHIATVYSGWTSNIGKHCYLRMVYIIWSFPRVAGDCNWILLTNQAQIMVKTWTCPVNPTLNPPFTARDKKTWIDMHLSHGIDYALLNSCGTMEHKLSVNNWTHVKQMSMHLMLLCTQQTQCWLESHIISCLNVSITDLYYYFLMTLERNGSYDVMKVTRLQDKLWRHWWLICHNKHEWIVTSNTYWYWKPVQKWHLLAAKLIHRDYSRDQVSAISLIWNHEWLETTRNVINCLWHCVCWCSSATHQTNSRLDTNCSQIVLWKLVPPM